MNIALKLNQNSNKVSLFTIENGETQKFFIENSIFIFFQNDDNQKNCSAIVKNWGEDFLNDKNIIDTIESYLEKPVSKLTVKLIGNEKLIQKYLPSFEAQIQSKEIYVAERKLEKIEVIYLPKTGKLQVEKDITATPITEIKTKTKVLIVDDSPTIRKLLSKLFSESSDFEVVGATELPSQVEGLIQKNKPDVITMDVHMPEMDGVTLLKKLLPKYRIPTVMITSISKEEGNTIMTALENGAVDYIQKPSIQELPLVGPSILEKVKMASKVKVSAVQAQAEISKLTTIVRSKKAIDQKTIIAIGSSTGGTEALKEVLIRMPEHIPPILIVQHIPPVFSLAFANRLNEMCPFEVKEAQDGDEVIADRVLIAPGGKQMKVVNRSGKLIVQCTDDEPVNRHKPSVDYLFDSVAKVIGKNAIGVILTGMGADGAKGMLQMRSQGSKTIAQDEQSCVVFGMPKEAIKIGAAQEICNLVKIPDKLIEWL